MKRIIRAILILCSAAMIILVIMTMFATFALRPLQPRQAKPFETTEAATEV